jgi:Ca-activated chloride channel family protein
MALPHSKPCDLLLVTDGEIYGIEDVLATALSAGHRIFVVGIGASPAEIHLRRLATATGGACELVAPGEAVEPAVLRMFHRLRSPGVSDLRIEWPQGCATMDASSVPASAFDGDTVTVFGRLEVDKKHISQAPVRLLGKYNGQPGEVVLAELTLEPIEDPANTVSRLWANSRCDELAEAGDVPGGAAALAERYQLVTDHTNFVLVHERSAEDKQEDMPELRQVSSMLAAGWGGLGRTRSRSRFVEAPDVQYSIAPALACKSVLVGGTNRSLNLTMCDDFDEFDTPSFLRKSTDDDMPFEVPTAVSKTNPDWWARILDLEADELELYASESSQHGWNEGYIGLTPAGLFEFLRINAKENCPTSYAGLVDAGLGYQVAEWLEFVVGVEFGESLVVRTFLNVVSEISFFDVQESFVAGGRIRTDPPRRKSASAPDTLARLMAQALLGAQPRRWPEQVVHFAEAHVVD